MRYHQVQLVWVPANDRLGLVCQRCGKVVEASPFTKAFPYPGRCEAPEALGVTVRDGVEAEDEVGGS